VDIWKKTIVTYINATIQLICVSKINTTWRFRGSGQLNNTVTTISYEIPNLIINLLTVSIITSQNNGKYECVHKRNKQVILGDYTDVLVYKSPTHILEGENNTII